MALTINKLSKPIKVTGTTDASAKVTDRLGYVKFIHWYNVTTSGHLLSLTDKNGTEVVKLKAEKDGDTITYPVLQEMAGIYCDDMDSGTLYINMR